MCEKGPIAMSDLRSVQRQRQRINPITGRSTRSGANTNTDSSETPAEDDGKVTIGKVDLVSSTKLRALVRRLEVLRVEDPEMKALVFSQFTSFLDLIETTLDKAGIRYL
jgi:DNA repair protein RAD5